MLAKQGKPGDLVVKMRDLPGLLTLTVALQAVAALKFALQMIFVKVGVASQALLLGQFREFILGRGFALWQMASGAFDLGMVADERVAGRLFMIELGAFPRRVGMASAALLGRPLRRKGVDVIFAVATITGLGLTKEAWVTGARHGSAALFGMAVDAFDLGVRTMQDEAGLVMVKRLGVDGRAVEVAALVITMATDTSLFGHAVKAFALANRLLDIAVASQAFGIGDAFARIMTLKAGAVFE